MNNFLNKNITVYNEIKNSDFTVGDICQMANIPKKTVYGWVKKDPKSIEQLKSIAGVVNSIDGLKKIGVKVQFDGKTIELSNGMKFDLSDKPINQQIRELAKDEMKNEHTDKELDLLIKIFKVCR
jgi:hypothetical protein